MAEPYRSKKYLAFVRSLPCSVRSCRRKSDAAHIGSHGLSTKAPDNQTVPLCRAHHDELGGPGGRRTFESKYDLNLLQIAQRIALRPSIKVEGDFFVGRVEDETAVLCALSDGLREAVRRMVNLRRESLKGEGYILAPKMAVSQSRRRGAAA